MKIEKTILLICGNCGKEFFKSTKEYTRHLKKGRNRFFCSRSCACLKKNEENPPKGNPDNFKNYDRDNRKRKFNPFKKFVNQCKSRNKRTNPLREINISEKHLKKIWEDQNGICPFSGLHLLLPTNSSGTLDFNPNNASVDRIDNGLGYVENNVRFVSVMANYARNLFTDEQLINFCKAVAINKS
jgi:uncharacterized C2H2 Zn-finger protein